MLRRVGLRATLRADLAASRQYGGSVILSLYPGFTAVLLYRLSRSLWRWPWKPIAWAIFLLEQLLTGAEIPPTAEFGPGLFTPHPYGIVVVPKARCGSNVVLFGGVVLGAASPAAGIAARHGEPVLGDWVTLFAKASVIGPVRVGDRATIGAHALVLTDVADRTVVGGVPARVLRVTTDQDEVP
jgi:serine O-acetyltransferase